MTMMGKLMAFFNQLKNKKVHYFMVYCFSFII